MSFLTDEERLHLLQTAFNALGTLIQDHLDSPALTYALDPQVKKSTKVRRDSFQRVMRSATALHSFRSQK